MGLFDILGGKGRRDSFAKRVMERLREQGWLQPISYDPEGFTLWLGEPAGVVALHRIFHDWSKHPRRAEAATFDEAIAFIHDLGPPPPFETAAPMLRPAIRGRAVVEAVLRDPTNADGTSVPTSQALGEHLTCHVALDRPSSLTLVDGEALKAWGRTFEECLEIALSNLRASNPVRFERHELGFLFAICEDHNEAARLMTPEVFTGLELEGDPVVVAAARNCVLVAGAKDIKALTLIGGFAPNYLEDHGWPLSYAPMILREGQWRGFRPSHGPVEIADLHVRQRLFDYAEQRPMLDISLENRGVSEDVAELTLFPTENGLVSLVLWSAARMLLPEADFAVIRLDKGHVVVRAWGDVAAACGLAPFESSTAAPYFLAAAWPDGEALARLEVAPEPEWARGRGLGIANGRLTVFG